MKKYINRTMEKTVEKYIGKYPVIMITGPRQVGKTTLINYLISKHKEEINFVSLDDMVLRMQANEDPELFLRTHETPLFIDEFQYAPNLLTYIKMNVDKARKNEMFGDGKDVGTLYYLTGSQIFETMEDVSESLAGRVGIFDLFAFSNRELNSLEEKPFTGDIKEIKKRKNATKLSTLKIFSNILNGSYPELVTGDKNDFEYYYSNYIRTYIERDVRKLINIQDENKFVKFISCVAARTGQEFNGSSIGSEIGIDNKTVDKWISILKNTGIIYMLQPYSNNNVSKAIKRPKIYFMDTGLACYLTGYTDAKILEKGAYSGAIFETYVISEIIKSYTNNAIDPTKHLYYYRDNRQKEIDLLIVNNGKVTPLEIKKSSMPTTNMIKNFDVVSNFELESSGGIVLCMCDKIIAIDDNNYAVPLEYV